LADDHDLRGRRVLVTGASSGIGAALARGLAAEGAVVALSARRADRLDEVLADCRATSPDSCSIPLDLAEPDAPERLVTEAEQALGGIDVLVNNAGIPKRRAAEDLSTDEVEQVVRLNLLSAMRLTLAALPNMRAAGWGRLVVVSSVAARLSPPGESAYAATKAGLAAFHESLAAELWGSGVTVHLINPGVIDTELYVVPGNDPSFADVEALPADALVEPTLRAMRDGTLETWVPEWFADVAVVKAGDLAGFVQGAAEYRAQQLAAGVGPDAD
jgi:short-subunit dehydrogenase